MNFGEKIMDYKSDILADLSELIAIESISGIQESCSLALDWILNKAKSFGFDTKNIENVAGHVQLGNKGTLCGVLSHLDVVPAGNNWNSLPFELSVGDGYMYGRGIADNKGAALINLYCLKALKDNNVIGNNTLRAIYGTKEETGMDDMITYFKHEEIPELSFTPDASYGICNAEKGILQVEIYADTHDGITLTQFHSGKSVNAIPDTAYALLDCTENDDHQLTRLADGRKGNFDFYYTIDGLMVISHGIAAHASTPNLGLNAAANLASLLSANFSFPALGKIPSFITTYLQKDIYGIALGIKCNDNISGPLTVSLGTVHIDDGYATCTLDIRYPISENGNKIYKKLSDLIHREGLNIKIISHTEPLYVDENSEIVNILSDAYFAIESEKPNIYSTGGGTYARMLHGNGVAFGPVFPGEESNLHNANEKLNVDKFFEHAKICLEAMYRLYTKE